MDLYIFCVVLGAAGMAAMALLGFTSSHGGGAHDTGGHEFHGVAGHIHTTATPHAGHTVAHAPVGHGHAPANGVGHGAQPHVHVESWKTQAFHASVQGTARRFGDNVEKFGRLNRASFFEVPLRPFTR